MKEFNKVSFESSDSLPLGLMESDDGDEEIVGLETGVCNLESEVKK